MLRPKTEIHTRKLITKKNSCGSEIPPPPPHGPSLKDKISLRDPQCPVFLYHSASASATELEVNGFPLLSCDCLWRSPLELGTN